MSLRPGLAAILRPLPRRAAPPRPEVTVRARPVEIPRPRFNTAALRLTLWSLVSLLTLLRVAVDVVARRYSLRRVGRHLRWAFAYMGATGTKLGQQLSIRVDLLPFELCDELSTLTDRAPPIPLPAAIAEIEAAIGGPLETQFKAFDPDPVGAASIACVYRAELHSGEAVAVKVQRPKVAQRFADDLFAFNLMTELAENFGVVRPNFFAFLRIDLSAMFLEELDFEREARMQRLFMRYVRRDRLDWLTAPRVYSHLCGPRVMVSEFVEAVSCADILRVTENASTEGLRQLKALDIDPEVLGRRIYHLSAWSRLEVPFFHADPHPANLLVLPGNRVCLIDFGAVGTMGTASSRLQHATLERMQQEDVYGLVQAMRRETSPIPGIDLDAVTEEMEARFRRFQLALLDSESPWWEKTTAGLWVAMLETCRRFQMPINLNTLRMIRGTLLYDTLSFRMAPSMTLKENQRYLGEALERQARYARRRLRDARVLESLPPLDHVLRRVEAAAALPMQFEAAVSKAGAAALFLARGFAMGVTLLLGTLLLAAIASSTPLGHSALWQSARALAWQVVTSPTTAAALVLLALPPLTQLRRRLDEARGGE